MMLHHPSRSHGPRSGNRRRAGGFTLIELLVVLGIIILVAALVTVGIRAALSGVIDRSTQTRLETLDSMLAAFATADTATGGAIGDTRAKRLPSALWARSSSDDYYSTRDAGVGGSAAAAVSDAPGQPIDVAGPLLSSFGPEVAPQLVASPAVARTQAVMRRLLSVPSNRSTFDSLPDDAKSVPMPTTGSVLRHVDDTADFSPLDPALIADGHNGVILFVPESGLTGLQFQDGTQLVANAGSGAPWRLVAADGGAFWASAGADGNFSTGDDNVYSRSVVVEDAP